MTLMFPQGDDICKFEIKPADKVLEGHIGYRKGNQLMLRNDIFYAFIHYCKQDNFPEMKKIVDGLIDLNSRDLPGETNEPVLIQNQDDEEIKSNDSAPSGFIEFRAGTFTVAE